MSLDVNSMKPLDNLTIHHGYTGGRGVGSGGVRRRICLLYGRRNHLVRTDHDSALSKGDKIILPRNVHRSAINALILCGAVPIYVNPAMNHELGISLGMSIENVERAITENPDAKAIFVNNPTYYGICSNLKAITELAHRYGMKVLVDEAHGTHFYFGNQLPISAMAAGADMASVSMHKSGGSLTQSSFCLPERI